MMDLSKYSVYCITVLLVFGFNSALVCQTESIQTDQNPNARKGPSNNPFYIFTQIESDYDFQDQKILGVYNTIFRDQNIKSGYFYYLPASYSLNWSEKTGQYDFDVDYGVAGSDGRGRATITAILKPKLSKNEIVLVEDLLKQNIYGKEEQPYGIKDLIPIPMAKAPEIAFDNLSQFGVQQNDISIRPPSELMDPIYISFSSDRIDDLMGVFFNQVGLFGDVVIYPAGENMPESIRVPFHLKIDGPSTFGKFELNPNDWRQKTWKNETDFPVILTHFHVMKKENSGKLAVYTWLMGDIEIPEKAKIEFDASLVPGWIDQSHKIQKIWMEYAIQTCQSCNTVVKDKIIGGVSRKMVQNISFTTLNLLEFTEAYMIKIRVRSYQFDPTGLSNIELSPSITIKSDDETFAAGQLIIPDGNKANFEYFIEVYMEDGTRYASDFWKKSQSPDVVLGSKQLIEMIPHFQ